jgi:hypothetical protein
MAMNPSAFVVRRIAPLLLIAGAAALVWLAFTFVAPYAIEHPTGAQNPSFIWYLLYRSLPLLVLLAVATLLFAAWILWKGGRVDVGLSRGLERSSLMRSLGVRSGLVRHVLFFVIVGTASAAGVVAAFAGLIAVLALLSAIHA